MKRWSSPPRFRQIPPEVFRIFPPASGRILGIEVKPGDIVSKGQALAMLDSSDAASARSDFAKAKIEAERATRAADREKVLFEHGAIAEKDYIDRARRRIPPRRNWLARGSGSKC